MQCVYSAFIFRYRLVPTGSENPKVCVRDVCREFACELESNVCRSRLTLIVLPALPTYRKLPAVQKKGGRKSRDGSFRNKQKSALHTQTKRGNRKNRKKITTHLLTRILPQVVWLLHRRLMPASVESFASCHLKEGSTSDSRDAPCSQEGSSV